MLPSRSPLTPTLSRVREREQEQQQQQVFSPLSRKPEQEQASGSLSRTRERVRVRARALRGNQTAAEALLWSRLRSNQLLNLKFRRQRPIGPYFADFVCMEVRLVIELDGGQHLDAPAQNHDAARSRFMSDLGYQTLRFWNHDVLTQTEAVLEKILQTAETLTPALSRVRERGQDNPEGRTS
jgi:very-short-patch-repair endonuclease